MDPYYILGVSKNCNKDEIKKTYHNLILKYHPDKNNDENAREMFIKIKTAYEILIDDEKKEMYNKMDCDKQNYMFAKILKEFYDNDGFGVKTFISNILFGKQKTIIDYIITVNDIYENVDKHINIVRDGMKQTNFYVPPRAGKYIYEGLGENGGDLIIKVIYLEDDEYKIIDNDIIITKIISLEDYIYGGSLKLIHIDKRELLINFKSMLDSAPIITLDNEGVKNTNGKLYVMLKINKININVSQKTNEVIKLKIIEIDNLT